MQNKGVDYCYPVKNIWAPFQAFQVRPLKVQKNRTCSLPYIRPASCIIAFRVGSRGSLKQEGDSVREALSTKRKVG